MQDVAIIGAGQLGGNLAHVLAVRDVVRSIRLIDSAGSVAAGKALDVMQASPIEQFSTEVAGVTDISYVAGATLADLARALAERCPALRGRVLDPASGWPLDGYTFAVDERFTRDRSRPIGAASTVLLVASAAGGAV